MLVPGAMVDTDHRAIAIDDDAHTHVALDGTLYVWGDESAANC